LSVDPHSARTPRVLTGRWAAVLALAVCGAALVRGDGAVAPRPTPLSDALFALAREWTHDLGDDDWARAQLDRMAAEVRRAQQRDPALSRATALSRTVFGRFGFVREVDDTSLRFVLLPSVLRARRGSCVGLASVYLALAERLGWEMSGVMVPGHFFVRLDEPSGATNLELLHRGEAMPDAWYEERFPIAGGAAPAYARELATSEVLGVVEYDVGNERRREGRLEQAHRAFERARRHFPDFAEAHASLGAIAQLLGALDEARAGYEAARRVNPNLPGVDHNLELLDSELRRGAGDGT